MARSPGRWRRLLLAGALTVFWLPALQTLLLNLFDPLVTFTMVQRTWEHLWEDHALDLPRRDWVDLEDMPCTLLRSVLTSEDSAFFSHHGFDERAIREAWDLNRRGQGSKIRGASTISQQTARNVFLWLHRSWFRKGLEAWYTVWMELLVPKERILEVYLNVAETGPMVFGVEAAARHYFKKPVSKLTPEEAAGIVAVLPSPRRWRPTSGYAASRIGHLVGHPGALPRDVECVR